MRKVHVFGLALFAVFAFSVAMASVASAHTFLLAEWLAGGNPFTGQLSVEAIGKLLLEDTKGAGILGSAAMECEGRIEGWVEGGSTSANLIIAVLNNTLEEVSAAKPLACVSEKNCVNAEAYPVLLPWPTEVELMEESSTKFWYVVLIFPEAGNKIGWHASCGGVADECTSTAGVYEVMNEMASTLGLFAEAITELAGLKLADCTVGGPETGVVEGEGLIEDTDKTTVVTASSGV